MAKIVEAYQEKTEIKVRKVKLGYALQGQQTKDRV